ncbi:MAG TPA: DNA/RNA helicase domain-containing protein, partial [Pyrinomonadaceae bacterium]|nr:DNA/RNA helicase domain-containing protein [Pyrinomonadaceae bacterium]
PKAKRSDRPLIEHIIEAAKVTVFFIDDLQVVRPDEVGRVALIEETVQRMGVNLYEFELETQFRCNGSDGFVKWVDNTLGLRPTANECWDINDPFEFKIFNDVRELERAIRDKQTNTDTARLVAGFCWKWSAPDAEGNLIGDVAIGDWAMPWNAKSDAGRLAAGIPRSHFWASDPKGINQVGCIYTAQNFEFDYVGVIFGLDLRYDTTSRKWVADKNQSFDSVVTKAEEDHYLALVKNAYRVLLTRGLKGCYVYFLDPATRDYFESRLC